MNQIPFEICLFSITNPDYDEQCPWRQYLKKLNLQWSNLNYFNCENINLVLETLNTWFDSPEDHFTKNSFPFIIYKTKNSNDETYYKDLITIRSLEQLETDQILNEYKQNDI